MKWAEELIGKIQSLSVRKADDPTSGDKGGGSIEDLAMEAANKMENGEIEPDADSAKDFLVSNGVDESEAGDFAKDIIDAYFSEDDPKSGEGDGSGDKGDVNKSKDPTQDEANSDQIPIQKSMERIEEALSVLGYGLTHILDELQATRKENAVLKSQVDEYLGKPVRKSTVEQVAPGAGQESGRSTSETKTLILKGVQAGELTTEDMTAFEVGRVLTDKAKHYINKAGA